MKFPYITVLKFILLTALSIPAICISESYSQVSEEWIHRYTGPEASTDTPSKFFIDQSGNFYVTGRALIGGGYYHIVTVKFNPSGVRQWIAKYVSASNQNDEGISIGADAGGNVYVCGTTRLTSGQFDIILLKYNSSGVQQWIQQYNGTGNADDFASDCVTDTSGNTYIGGYTYTAGTGYNYILLKYNSSGTQQWIKTWNGASNSDDIIKKLKFAQNGDIFLTGSSYSVSSNNDFVTQRYNTAGTLLWTQNYNGPLSLDDQVSDLKTDVSDNVYITGKSRNTGIGYDFATVKYNSSGVQQWASRFNNAVSNDDVPFSMTIDNSGNVIVSGWSNFVTTYQDYLTVKYNSSGVQQWFRTYDGNDHYFDKAAEVRSDNSGNIFVTGKSLKLSDGTSDAVTIKYNSSGDLQWKETFNGAGNLDDDPVQMEIFNNSLYILSISSSYFFAPFCGTSDYLTLNYSFTGSLMWEARYDGSGTGIDLSSDLVLDNSGNCYVTGYSYDRFSLFDYATIKYNSSGAPVWVSRYDANYSNDKANSVAVDNSGNVYVTGSSIGTSPLSDIATVKYTSGGQEAWIARYNGPANGEDIGVKVAVDISGNVYVAGYSDGSGSGKDYVIVKYNSSGVQQWASRYNGTANGDDILNSMILDADGNTFVTGKSAGTGTLEDIATLKYNSSGSQQWVSRYNGPANNSDIGNNLISDINGNIIVNGITKTSAASGAESQIANYDIITVKYNPSGVQQWAVMYNGTENSDDDAGGIVSDNSGNVYLAGSAKNTGTDLDFTTIKYNPSGTLVWSANYNGSMNSSDKATGISIDLSGSLYVTGFCKDNMSNMNYSTVKYSSSGVLKWQEKYNYLDNDSDKAGSVKTDNSGNVFVTGISKSNEGNFDYTTIKYRQSKTLELTSLVEGFYDNVSDTSVPDSLKVIIRSSVSPYNILDVSSSVSGADGKADFYFDNVQNNTGYYIVLVHRNSIDTWSSNTVIFISGNLSYNFTDNINKAYGNNMKQKGSRFCIFSGDGNKDDVIDASDVSGVENETINTPKGRNQWDLNGDETVDASDLSIVENNTIEFTEVIRP